MSAYSKQDSRQVVGRFTQSNAFWQSFIETVPRSPRAFLGMYLKEAARLMTNGTLQLSDERLIQYAAREDVSPIDRRKILSALLPCSTRLHDAELLLRLFGSTSTAERAAVLLSADTTACLFLLFQEMQRAEGDDTLHERVCRELIRRGAPRHFKLAALMCSYFGLQSVRATFALRLAPYQLSRFDGSYHNFQKLIET